MALLDDVKLAMGITFTERDSEIQSLIDAAQEDLGIVGITVSTTSAITKRAIITYCRCNFDSPTDYANMKSSYDELKAQLQSATGYGL